jgi:hypothetical protein
MSDTVNRLGPAGDSTYGHGKRRGPSAETPGRGGSGSDPQDSPSPKDTRLIIEGGEVGESAVFTTVDSRTGAVIRKLPGEQVLRLGQAESYVAGQLIKMRA